MRCPLTSQRVPTRPLLAIHSPFRVGDGILKGHMQLGELGISPKLNLAPLGTSNSQIFSTSTIDRDLSIPTSVGLKHHRIGSKALSAVLTSRSATVTYPVAVTNSENCALVTSWTSVNTDLE